MSTTPNPSPDNPHKWFVLLSIGIGTFMSALDGSVVNTILPIIQKTFSSDVAAVEWVVVIYLLVVSGLLLTFGRLGDLRGHRNIYIMGLVLFIAGSALCGLSNSTTMLVVFRGFQALGAAMISANSPAILIRNFPASQRGQALGMQATMTYLGLTVGPSLGGWLAQAVSWRAVFYINIPVGLLALFFCLRFIPVQPREPSAERFDRAGALLFLAGLVALLLGLNQGHAWGWTSAPILGLLAAAVVLLAVFLRVERRSANPMLDLSLFSRPIFSASVASAVLNYIALFVVIYMMPFYLIQGRGLDPAHAGLLLTAQPVVMAVFAPLAGTLSDRIGSRLPATLGMIVLAGGLALLSRLTAASHTALITGGLAVCGLGTGLFTSPNNSALMGSAPRNRQGIASGTLATARNVGMVLGTGISGAVLATYLEVGPEQIFSAVRTGFLVAAGIALLGALISSTRGQN